MKLLKTIFLAIIFLISFCSIANAQLYVYEPYVMPSLSIRTLGMGGAYIAVADDKNVLFHNPAGLGLYGLSISVVSAGLSVGDINSDVVSKDIFGDGTNPWTVSFFDIPTIMDNITNLTPSGEGLSSLGTFIDKLMRTKIGFNLAPSIDLGFIIKNFGFRTFDYSKFNMKYNKSAGFIGDADILAYGDAGAIFGISFQLFDIFYVGANIKYVARLMVAENNIGISKLLGLMSGGEESESNSLLDELVHVGSGLGTDLGLLVKLGNLKLGLTITDWLGGTTINYGTFSQANLNPFGDTGSKSIIPPTVNVGAAFKMDQLLFIPKWLIKDIQFAADIRKLLIIAESEPSYSGNIIFNNIYMGVEATFFDIPFIRYLLLVPIKVGVGFYQGNFSFYAKAHLLWITNFGIAIWSEEQGERIGEMRVTHFALVFELFSFDF